MAYGDRIYRLPVKLDLPCLSGFEIVRFILSRDGLLLVCFFTNRKTTPYAYAEAEMLVFFQNITQYGRGRICPSIPGCTCCDLYYFHFGSYYSNDPSLMSEFNNLDDNIKIRMILTEGIYLKSAHHTSCRIDLYALGNLFIEVVRDPASGNVIHLGQINAEGLDKYLHGIDLPLPE